MNLSRRHMAFSLAAVLVLVVGVGQAQVSASRYDREIQQLATNILSSRDNWKGISTSTGDSIVTLEGSVQLYIDKVDAGRKVSKISPANGVRNHVRVEGDMPDAHLQTTLSEKLTYDRIGYGVMFNVLSLQIQSGVVTVGGDVRDYPSRDSALAIVGTTPGVKDVIDEINVLPTSIFDDELRIRTARAIDGQAALQRYAMVPEKPIRIILDNGHVTLQGVVDNTMDRQISETQAKSVSGVFSVDNRLVVATRN